MHRPIGRYLVEEGYVEAYQLAEALGQQERLRRKRLGDILVERHGLSRKILNEVVREQLEALCRMDDGERPWPLGKLLVDKGLIAQHSLEHALWWQERLRRKRIGDILVELRYIERDRLEQAIREQLAELAVA